MTDPISQPYEDRDPALFTDLAPLSKLDRRALLQRAAALGIGSSALPAFLAACGSSSSSSSASSTSSQHTPLGPMGRSAQGTPRHGGTLRMSWQYQPVSQMDPQLPTQGNNGALNSLLLIHDQLMNLQPDSYYPVHGLAESHEVFKNGLEYVFTLRPAMYSNGQQVTTQDVKFCLDRFASPKINQYATLLSAIESTKVLDANRVLVKLSYAQGWFLDAMTHATASIVPQNLVEKLGKAFGQKPVGAGAFKFGSKNPTSVIQFVRNEHYWKAPKPYLDGAVMTYYPDDTARVLSVVSGQADAAVPVSYSLLPQYLQKPGLRLQIEPTSIFSFINPQCQRHPFQDPNVRLALNYATPVETIIRVVMHGYAQHANNTWGKLRYWDPSVPPIPYDLAKAKAYLKKSIVPNGFSTSISIVGSDTDTRTIAQIVQSAWAPLGVKLSINGTDITTLTTNTLNGNFDMYLLPLDDYDSDVDADDEDALFILNPLPLKFGQQYYYDKQVATEMTQVTHTTNETLRRQIFANLAHQALYVDPPVIPLAFGPERTLVTDKLQGLVTQVNTSWRMENVWFNA